MTPFRLASTWSPPNKEVMAKHGPELMSLAQGRGVNLLFEASVGGGIPIVGCLMNELLANQVHSIRGIINGTTNYILTRMANQFTDFHQALAEAQEMGYAEADPTNDVEGTDAAYKLAILASLAFHQQVQPEEVYRQGIGSLEAKDFRYAHELGFAIKSLAIATRENGAIRARVPSLPGPSGPHVGQGGRSVQRGGGRGKPLRQGAIPWPWCRP